MRRLEQQRDDTAQELGSTRAAFKSQGAVLAKERDNLQELTLRLLEHDSSTRPSFSPLLYQDHRMF